MFLCSFIEKADVLNSTTQSQLRENVVSTLRLTLSNLAGDFRTSQAKFLKQIEARKETVNSYLLASSDWVNTEVLDDAPVDEASDGNVLIKCFLSALVSNSDFYLLMRAQRISKTKPGVLTLKKFLLLQWMKKKKISGVPRFSRFQIFVGKQCFLIKKKKML